MVTNMRKGGGEQRDPSSESNMHALAWIHMIICCMYPIVVSVYSKHHNPRMKTMRAHTQPLLFWLARADVVGVCPGRFVADILPRIFAYSI
jgi:hypothetical protein